MPLLGEPEKITKKNDQKIEQFRSRDPRDISRVRLDLPTPYLRQLAYGFAISIIGIELWLAVMMWLAPNWLLTHLSLLAFIITLGVLRQEFTFISIVCALGLMTTDSSRPFLRIAYATLGVLTAAAILKTLN